ncbi:MAG: PAS domain-containing protein [Polyangiaceae bacterium]
MGSEAARIRELERELEQLKQQLAAGSNRYAGDPRLGRLLGDPLVLENFPHVISVLDRERRILYLNRTVPGRSVGEFIGTDSVAVVAPDERERYVAAFEQAWRSAQPSSAEFRTLTRWFEARFVPMSENGEVVFMLSTATDITRHKAQEQALRESEGRARLSLLASGVGTWTWSPLTDELFWDDALCEIFGVAPEKRPRGRDEYLALVHPEDRGEAAAIIARYVRDGVYEGMAYRIVRPDGAIRHVIAKGVPVFDDAGNLEAMRGGVLDVTERKELEASLEQAQRMQAVGQLTAGIAHNLNNALTVILPNVAECRELAGGVIAERLADVEHASTRAAEMVRQLMLFARPQATASRRAFDVHALAHRIVEMCRSTFDKKIELRLAPSALPPALGNAGQIEQVLLNVCLNARDAVLDAARAEPRIEVELDAATRGRVRISVSDNGAGMTEAVRARIFEPFFTTKEVGRGTGLGLASAYAIVTDHGGSIRCTSRVGEGTRFEIELPAAPEAPHTSMPAPATVPAGTETVLLVDDEGAVRRVLRRMLERSGFSVLESEDGAEALALFEQGARHVDALIIDRSMPGLSGEQVLEKLTEMCVSLPIILLSGHPDAELENPDVVAILTKPISRQLLINEVRKAIDERKSRQPA